METGDFIKSEMMAAASLVAPPISRISSKFLKGHFNLSTNPTTILMRMRVIDCRTDRLMCFLCQTFSIVVQWDVFFTYLFSDSLDRCLKMNFSCIALEILMKLHFYNECVIITP